MQKKAYPIRKPDFPRRKQKTLQCFLFQNGGYRTPKTSPGKLSEKSGKIQFPTKNRHSVPSSWTLFVRVNIVRQLYLLFFFFWLTLLVFLDVLSLLDIVPYLNLVVWISSWCHLCDIWIKFVSFWGPMEATFSSWILSSKLSGTYNLRVLNMGNDDSRIHHMQTFFLERSLVRHCLEGSFASPGSRRCPL